MKSFRIYELATLNSSVASCRIFRRQYEHRGFGGAVLLRSQPKTTKSWLASTSFGRSQMKIPQAPTKTVSGDRYR